eukprot:1659955-Rhodomonas_salina.1
MSAVWKTTIGDFGSSGVDQAHTVRLQRTKQKRNYRPLDRQSPRSASPCSGMLSTVDTVRDNRSHARSRHNASRARRWDHTKDGEADDDILQQQKILAFSVGDIHPISGTSLASQDRELGQRKEEDAHTGCANSEDLDGTSWHTPSLRQY